MGRIDNTEEESEKATQGTKMTDMIDRNTESARHMAQFFLIIFKPKRPDHNTRCQKTGDICFEKLFLLCVSINEIYIEEKNKFGAIIFKQIK